MNDEAQAFRVTITLGGAATDPLMERGFTARWDPPGETATEVRLEAGDLNALAPLVGALPTGKINFDMIREAAPVLGYLLRTSRLHAAELVELEADGTTTVLTELPWEAAARGSEPLPPPTTALFERLLAPLPICRLVPATSRVAVVGNYRPRLLLCISNPPGVDGGQIAVGPIQTACDQALQLYPVFQARKLCGPLTWAAVNAIIARFRPNVLIVVGHGSSNPAGGDPTLAFVREGDPGGVDRVPVARLADALARAGSCCAAVLIACDLVRASGHSAAWELVRQGVGEVVAMQGSVQQQCARVILAALLNEILAGAPLPSAAATARRASMDHPHAILPAVFRASDRSRAASELAPLAARYGRALGNLYARVSETRAMLKRGALQHKVEEILGGTGVAAVEGAFGNGCSTLLRAAVASLLAKPVRLKSRPVLYIDCDRRLGHLPLSEWISDQIHAATTADAVLKPITAPDFTESTKSGDEAGAWAVEAEISVVLDNLPLHPTNEDKVFLEGFARPFRRPDGQACLVLGGSGDLLKLAKQETKVVVGPLSLPETEDFANTVVPGTDGQELYMLTGGTLLLLDAERRMRTRARRTQRMFQGSESTLELYLERLDEGLSPGAREAAARLALFRYPLDVRLAEGFVTPDLPGAIEELVEAGLAMSFEDNTITWLLVPERKARGIQTRTANDLEEIKETLAKNFDDRYEGCEDEVVHEVTSLAGAGEYLKIVQLYLANSALADVAVAMPILAQGTALRAEALFELFEQSVQILDASGTKDVDTMLFGSRAAINVGKLEIAQQWVSRLPKNLDPVSECRCLALKAAILKDQRQVTSLQEILECFSKATEVIARRAPEEQTELDELRKEIVFDSLPAALFLGREGAESAAKRLDPIFPRISPTEKAHLLATLAEREMSEPPEKVNWSSVANWVTEALELLQGGADARTLTYCAYQQAQYLRKRSKPHYRDAWQGYRKAKAAGEQAGEVRREGLALLRLVELERDLPELREDPSDWPSRRLAEVDKIVSGLWNSQVDALSMRVLGRLQVVAVGLDLNVDSQRERLTQAARAFSSGMLSSRNDNRRFAEVCLQALDLDLQPEGHFPLAQRFLASVRSELARRLGIRVDLDKPEAAREQLSQSLQGLSFEEGSHGQHSQH